MTTFFGTRRSDDMKGTDGHDVFWAGAKADRAIGGEGDDTFHDDPFQIIIPEKTGDDVFIGGQGDDVFEYVDGNDKIVGGGGEDTFVFANSEGYAVSEIGNKTIIETADGDIVKVKGVEHFEFL